MSTVKIEMIQDIVCSWCAIGYQYLNDALKDTGIKAEFSYLPHELNPDMPAEGIEIEHYFTSVYGWSQHKHDIYRRQLIETAKSAGVVMDFRYRTHYYNTRLAQQLLVAAEAEGKGRLAYETLLKAYHAKGINIAQVQEISRIGQELAISENAMEQVLNPELELDLFTQAKQRRAKFDTPSVPAFIFNDQHLVVGSQSRKFFREYLEQLIVIV